MCIEDMDLENMAKVIISKADQKKILADEDFCNRLMCEIGADKSADGNWLVDFDELNNLTFALEEFEIYDYEIEDADESYIPDDEEYDSIIWFRKYY